MQAATDAGLFDVSCREMWTDVFPCLSTHIQVCVWNLLIGYQCSCLVRHSVHHLSAQSSICLIFVDAFTLEGISDCACFQRWATMHQLETIFDKLLGNITRIIGKQDVVREALWGKENQWCFKIFSGLKGQRQHLYESSRANEMVQRRFTPLFLLLMIPTSRQSSVSGQVRMPVRSWCTWA